MLSFPPPFLSLAAPPPLSLFPISTCLSNHMIPRHRIRKQKNLSTKQDKLSLLGWIQSLPPMHRTTMDNNKLAVEANSAHVIMTNAGKNMVNLGIPIYVHSLQNDLPQQGTSTASFIRFPQMRHVNSLGFCFLCPS